MQIAFPLAAVGAALGLRLLFVPLTGTGAPFVLFFGAVLATALYCGPRSGIVASLLSAPIGSYEFVVRAGYTVSQSVAQAFLFFLECLVAVYLAFMVTKARRRAEVAANREREAARLSERLLAEVDRKHRLLQGVIDQLPAGVAVSDRESSEILVKNDAMETIWRGPVDAQKYDGDGRPFAKRAFAGDRAALTGESIREETAILRLDGTPAIILDIGAPIRDADGQIIAGVGVVIDVTAQKETERERERLLDETRRAVRARDHVLAVVSHDLRNPLNTISLSTELLLRPGSEGTEKRVERIQSAVQRMDAIVSDLMDIARIENGRFVVEYEDHDASSILEEAAGMFAEVTSQRRITLKTTSHMTDATVRCDRGRILQVLSNLIGNALKFTPPSRDIEIGCKRDGAMAVFFVRDGGPGIQPGDLPRVFDAYWQGDEPAMQKKGLGLGLAICREIIQAHGGRVWVKSAIGEGASFFFTTPAVALGE